MLMSLRGLHWHPTPSSLVYHLHAPVAQLVRRLCLAVSRNIFGAYVLPSGTRMSELSVVLGARFKGALIRQIGI